MSTGKLRPQIDHSQWRCGTLFCWEVSRVPLYWTPDPENSRVLRMLRSEQSVMFIPQVQYEHWVIVKSGEQIGWVDLRFAQLFEDEPPAAPENPFLTALPAIAEDDTNPSHPIIAAPERPEAPQNPAPDPPKTSAKDIRRAIAHLIGFR
ncbi:MAG: hypothetical protein ACOYL5_11325 [Phototrophicaceae bacterium]